MVDFGIDVIRKVHAVSRTPSKATFVSGTFDPALSGTDSKIPRPLATRPGASQNQNQNFVLWSCGAARGT